MLGYNLIGGEEKIGTDGREKVYKAYYFFIFGPVAIFVTYLNLHLKRIGWSDSQLGIISSIFAVMAVISPPIWGFISDLVGDRRKPILALLSVSGLLFPFFFVKMPIPVVLGIAVAFALFNSPIPSISDALALDHIARKGGDYGKIRLWGSMGFVFPLLVLWAVFRHTSSLLPAFLSFPVLRAISAIFLFRIPRGVRDRISDSGRGLLLNDLKELVVNIRFVYFLGIVLLSGVTMQVYYVFFSIYLEHRMVPDSLKGIFWAIGVISEIGFMAISGRIMEVIGERRMFLLGILGRAARLLFFSFPLSMSQIAAVQTLHALTFGAFHVASVRIIDEIVPERLRGSGQTLYYAMNMGLGGVIGSLTSGMISQELGLLSSFRVSAIFAFALFFLCLPFCSLKRDRERSSDRCGYDGIKVGG